MSKLYFLVPDTSCAERIVKDLKRAGTGEEDIGVLGKDVALADALPDADVEQTTDLKPAMQQGAAIGGATGLLAGLTATLVPGGFAVGGAALLGMTLAGSAFGAWASSLIGISVPNREVEEFKCAIEDGQVLMIINTANADRARIKAIVSECHPDVVYGGEEGNIRGIA